MKKQIPFLLLIVLSNSLCAKETLVGVGINSEYEYWRSGFGGNAVSIMRGINIGVYQDRWYGGISVSNGTYQINNFPDDQLERTDVDLVYGRIYDSHWSIFTGFRINDLSYEHLDASSQAVSERVYGLGVGVSYDRQIDMDFTFFSTVSFSALYSNTSYHPEINNIGRGAAINSELGLQYNWESNIRIASRFKYQVSKVKYSAGFWPHSYYRLGLNISIIF